MERVRCWGHIDAGIGIPVKIGDVLWLPSAIVLKRHD
jgi:hypothetical protein